MSLEESKYLLKYLNHKWFMGSSITAAEALTGETCIADGANHTDSYISSGAAHPLARVASQT